MLHFLLRRSCFLILYTFLTGSICFFVLRILPGDAALTLTGLEATAEDIQQAKAALGLDKNVLVQYTDWVRSLMHGNLGYSYLTKLPVGQEIVRRLPITLPLSICSFILASFISIPLGIIAAVHKKDAVGMSISAVSAAGVAVPAFWIGIILVWIVALRLHLLPAGGFPREGWGNSAAAVRSLVLPVFTVAAVMSASLIRYVRSAAQDVLRQDYIRTARSLGFSAFAVRIKHGLRNMAVPIMTILDIEFTSSLLGAVVIENVFALPGLGAFLLQGVRSRDFPVVQDIIFLITFFVLVIGFIIDILQHMIDPRLSYQERHSK